MDNIVQKIFLTESARNGQGRFRLPPCPMGVIRNRTINFNKQLPMFEREFRERGGHWPWDRVRFLTRRSHSLKDEGTGLRMELELKAYLELLLPLDHPNANVWTGISPRDLEWGKSTRTVLSDKKETMSREGLFPRGRRPV